MATHQRKIPIPPPSIFVFCALLMKILPPIWQFSMPLVVLSAWRASYNFY